MGKEYEFIYLLKEDIQKILRVTNHQGNTNQTTVGSHLTTVRMAIIKKNTNNKHCKDVGEREFSYNISGNVN